MQQMKNKDIRPTVILMDKMETKETIKNVLESTQAVLTN